MIQRFKWMWLFVSIMVLFCVFFLGCQKQTPYGGSAKLIIGNDGLYSESRLRSISSLGSNTYYNLEEGIRIKVTFKEIDKTTDVLPIAGPVVNGEQIMIQQCGKYRFEFTINGETLVVDDFHYAGESMVNVARGIGWYAVILRDEIEE